MRHNQTALNRCIQSALFATVGLALTTQAFAGSFALTTQSLSARGQANAGIGVLTNDHTTNDATNVYANPANIKGKKLSGAVSFSQVSADISNVTSADLNATNTGYDRNVAGQTNNGDMTDDIIIPALYMTTPIETVDGVEKTTFGLGLYATYGFNADYEDTFAGRNFANKSEFQSLTLAPTVAYHHSDSLSMGMSLNIARAEGELTSDISKSFPSSFALKGDDTRIGYTLGLTFKPIEPLTVGLVHRSKQKFKLEGDAKISATTRAGTYKKATDGLLELTTPNSTELSLGFAVTPKANLYATVTHTDWSVLPKVEIQTNFNVPEVTAGLIGIGLPATSAGVTALGVKQPTEVFKYKDSYTYAIGGDCRINDRLAVRLGVAYDETPTRDGYRSLRLPTTDRMIYAIGANVGLTKNLSLDVGYSLVDEDTAKISVKKYLPNGVLSSSYDADFNNSANVFMAQLNYKF